MTESVRVTLDARSYDIIVGDRLLAKAGDYIAPILQSKNIIVISDEHVARLYLHRLSNALEEHQIRFRSVILKPGETTKSLPAFSDLMETLLEQKPDRKTALVALGGGVIGDITGFAASALLRGVDFIQIPTSLLAQVDSSVGGKTGINSRFGKNLIGSFYQPRLVLSDVSVLATLPKRELMAGYAELLKYGLINDPVFFAWLEAHAISMLTGDNTLLAQAIVKSCQAKATIVVADEREAGQRALLNFGHTFGHALEAETGFSEELLHGEAVAIGMLLAFKASVAMGLCPKADLERVITHYQAVGLPLTPRYIRPEWDVDALLTHMQHDKKTSGSALTFIFTRGIGQALVAQNVEKQAIRELLAEACRGV